MTTEPGSAQDQSEIASQLNASLLGSVISMMFLVRHLGVCMAERDDAMVRRLPKPIQATSLEACSVVGPKEEMLAAVLRMRAMVWRAAAMQQTADMFWSGSAPHFVARVCRISWHRWAWTHHPSRQTRGRHRSQPLLRRSSWTQHSALHAAQQRRRQAKPSCLVTSVQLQDAASCQMLRDWCNNPRTPSGRS